MRWWGSVGVVTALGLACSGGDPELSPPTIPAPTPRAEPAPARGKGRTSRRKGRAGKAKTPARAQDPIEWVATELAREAPCAPDQPVCDVLRGAGRATRPTDGAWLGVAVPCIEPHGDRSKELTRLLQGDLESAEIAGLRVEGSKLQVFGMNPESDDERRQLDEVRSQVRTCLSHPGASCRMRVDPSVFAEIWHPDAELQPYHRDDAGHLVTHTDELTVELGSALAEPGWWVVNEHGAGEVVCNWLDIVVAVEPVAR